MLKYKHTNTYMLIWSNPAELSLEIKVHKSFHTNRPLGRFLALVFLLCTVARSHQRHSCDLSTWATQERNTYCTPTCVSTLQTSIQSTCSLFMVLLYSLMSLCAVWQRLCVRYSKYWKGNLSRFSRCSGFCMFDDDSWNKFRAIILLNSVCWLQSFYFC